MRWWMTMGSGGARSVCSRRGISVNFIRGTSNIFREIVDINLLYYRAVRRRERESSVNALTCWKYLSLLMYSLSWES